MKPDPQVILAPCCDRTDSVGAPGLVLLGFGSAPWIRPMGSMGTAL